TWVDETLAHRLQEPALGFALVFAVAEAAAAEVGPEFYETGQHFGSLHVPQAEFADAGGIDEVAALGEVVEPRRGGGVAALVGGIGKRSFACTGVGQQGIDQRRLAEDRKSTRLNSS